MNDTKTGVFQAINEVLGVDIEKIEIENALADDLGADSLDQVELIMAIEEQFSVEIDDEVAAGIRTVGDIINAVDKLKI